MTIRENRARTELWRRAKRMSLLSDESRQRILKTIDRLVEFHAVREGVDLPEESGTLPADKRGDQRHAEQLAQVIPLTIIGGGRRS